MVNNRMLKARRTAFAIKQAISTPQDISTKLSIVILCNIVMRSGNEHEEPI